MFTVQRLVANGVKINISFKHYKDASGIINMKKNRILIKRRLLRTRESRMLYPALKNTSSQQDNLFINSNFPDTRRFVSIAYFFQVHFWCFLIEKRWMGWKIIWEKYNLVYFIRKNKPRTELKFSFLGNVRYIHGHNVDAICDVISVRLVNEMKWKTAF